MRRRGCGSSIRKGQTVKKSCAAAMEAEGKREEEGEAAKDEADGFGGCPAAPPARLFTLLAAATAVAGVAELGVTGVKRADCPRSQHVSSERGCPYEWDRRARCRLLLHADQQFEDLPEQGWVKTSKGTPA